ncbi:MAG: hypothetical protein KJ666_04775 [Bacteroidetes bacterium]|nr:hypothetical protein [Bacteroidota bacterium]MBU2586000.1 hypothetical protein [Bacteroidota bacterium]
MTLKQICDVKDNQIVLTLPENFRDRKKVLVTINDSIDLKAEKFELLKQAVIDPLFLADIKQVSEDFNFIDTEAQ